MAEPANEAEALGRTVQRLMTAIVDAEKLKAEFPFVAAVEASSTFTLKDGGEWTVTVSRPGEGEAS